MLQLQKDFPFTVENKKTEFIFNILFVQPVRILI